MRRVVLLTAILVCLPSARAIAAPVCSPAVASPAGTYKACAAASQPAQTTVAANATLTQCAPKCSTVALINAGATGLGPVPPVTVVTGTLGPLPGACSGSTCTPQYAPTYGATFRTEEGSALTFVYVLGVPIPVNAPRSACASTNQDCGASDGSFGVGNLIRAQP